TGSMADLNPFRFSTKYADTETGLSYYGYRFYNAETGRWLNRDPIGEQGGLHLYGMADNNPVSWVDVLGLALYAFDGTWQDKDKSKVQNNRKRMTNVGVLHGIYEGDRHYETGVGSNW